MRGTYWSFCFMPLPLASLGAHGSWGGQSANTQAVCCDRVGSRHHQGRDSLSFSVIKHWIFSLLSVQAFQETRIHKCTVLKPRVWDREMRVFFIPLGWINKRKITHNFTPKAFSQDNTGTHLAPNVLNCYLQLSVLTGLVLDSCVTVGMSGFADDHSAVFIIICALLFFQSAAGQKMLVKYVFFPPPFYVTAIFPCWWCGSEEDIPGEESWPSVSPLRPVPLHAGHRQTHKDLCPIAERSR